ncbi:MAG: hypothetical protein ACRECV_15435 [Xanthobacteraceae bacterium]
MTNVSIGGFHAPFVGQEVKTVGQMEWTGMKNGELLAPASERLQTMIQFN